MAGPDACSGTSVVRHQSRNNCRYRRSGYLLMLGFHPGGVDLEKVSRESPWLLSAAMVCGSSVLEGVHQEETPQ